MSDLYPHLLVVNASHNLHAVTRSEVVLSYPVLTRLRCVVHVYVCCIRHSVH